MGQATQPLQTRTHIVGQESGERAQGVRASAQSHSQRSEAMVEVVFRSFALAKRGRYQIAMNHMRQSRNRLRALHQGARKGRRRSGKWQEPARHGLLHGRIVPTRTQKVQDLLDSSQGLRWKRVPRPAWSLAAGQRRSGKAQNAPSSAEQTRGQLLGLPYLRGLMHRCSWCGSSEEHDQARHGGGDQNRASDDERQIAGRR
jgi:hypothetical protein